MSQPRLSWDEYFMKMAFLVAERSTCLRRHVGALIAKDERIVSTGYNGAVAGVTHCSEIGCIRDKLQIKSGEHQETCNAIHAEQNAIIQSAIYGGQISGSTLYCTHSPCIICAKMIANAKIKRVICCHTYAEKAFVALFKEAGVKYQTMSIPPLTITQIP
jgi:dCMP deaminase